MKYLKKFEGKKSAYDRAVEFSKGGSEEDFAKEVTDETSIHLDFHCSKAIGNAKAAPREFLKDRNGGLTIDLVMNKIGDGTLTYKQCYVTALKCYKIGSERFLGDRVSGKKVVARFYKLVGDFFQNNEYALEDLANVLEEFNVFRSDIEFINQSLFMERIVIEFPVTSPELALAIVKLMKAHI